MGFSLTYIKKKCTRKTYVGEPTTAMAVSLTSSGFSALGGAFCGVYCVIVSINSLQNYEFMITKERKKYLG